MVMKQGPGGWGVAGALCAFISGGIEQQNPALALWSASGGNGVNTFPLCFPTIQLL